MFVAACMQLNQNYTVKILGRAFSTIRFKIGQLETSSVQVAIHAQGRTRVYEFSNTIFVAVSTFYHSYNSIILSLQHKQQVLSTWMTFYKIMINNMEHTVKLG